MNFLQERSRTIREGDLGMFAFVERKQKEKTDQAATDLGPVVQN